MEYNPQFRLYISTRLSNPHYPPEVATRTAIVNFTVKQDGKCPGLAVKQDGKPPGLAVKRDGKAPDWCCVDRRRQADLCRYQ